jgi:baseplate J-like protein
VKIPLPNLDDRRWSDLVDEGRSLIPTYAPDWTDHNVHDPGITVMELLAWVAEMDIYQLNRISDEHKRKFLALVGVTPEPPRAARNVLRFVVKQGVLSRELPAGAQFFARDLSGLPVPFRLVEPVTVVAGQLDTVQVKDRDGFHDVGNRLLSGESVPIFGAVPEIGGEIYFGFSEPLQVDTPVSLYFQLGGGRSGADERRRILEEIEARGHACSPPLIGCDANSQQTETDTAIGAETQHLVRNNRVRTVWEFFTGTGTTGWQPLGQDEVEDDTSAFTLDGRVLLTLPALMASKIIGRRESFYLRCRFEAGAYDAPPQLSGVALNGAMAEQAVPLAMKLFIAKDAGIRGTEPAPTEQTDIRFRLDEHGIITRLSFGAEPTDPQFTVLAFQKPAPTDFGTLTLEGVTLGGGDGAPNQKFNLTNFPVQQSSLTLLSLENVGTPPRPEWRRWTLRQDFDGSKRSDAHFLLDATHGTLIFGDGEKGRVPQPDAAFFTVYNWTRAEAGNLAGHETMEFIDGPHNRALIPNLDQVIQEFASITNAMSSVAGAPAETLDGAATRAIRMLNQTNRAVTLKDYERLALATPGAQLARAEARANRHPSFPCLKATGLITLVVLPNMPVARPTPSGGLKRAVASYLQNKRVIGTRVVVTGPDYLEISVLAKVKAFAGVSRGNLQQKIVAALNNFLSPLTGGPEGTGWPLGRDLYRSEVMQLIDQIVGVDNVVKLELAAGGCGPQCGNICLGPTSLIAAGDHVIEVI